MVIIMDYTKKRDVWKLGRVIKAYSSDNHVKKVEVRRGDGKIVHRDKSKIVLLEMNRTTHQPIETEGDWLLF